MKSTCRAVRSSCHSKRVDNQSSLTPAPSPGPTSPEGKARCSRNAEKHGMYSSAVLLHFESAEAFEELRQSYYVKFAPASQPEFDLVDQMIASTWRLRRLGALEAAAMDHAMDAQRATLDAAYQDLDLETRAHFAFDKLTVDSSTFSTYYRFQAAQTRQYDRAHRNLRLLQSNK